MPGGEPMKPAMPGVTLTYDDFVQFPDDGQRHELIDGAHVVTPSPSIDHQRIVGNLHHLLRVYLHASPVGEVFVAPLDVILSGIDVVEPDLLYVSARRRAQALTGTHVHGAPDLAIEVGSPSTRQRDETIKKRLYETQQVQEYWVVDPEWQTVRVYRRGDDAGFAKPVELAAERNDVLGSPLFPGLEIPLADIFSEPTFAPAPSPPVS